MESFLLLIIQLGRFVGKLVVLIGVLAVGWALLLIQNPGHLPFFG